MEFDKNSERGKINRVKSLIRLFRVFRNVYGVLFIWEV